DREYGDEAKLSKPRIQDTADRVASYFVPCVLLLTVVILSIWIAIGLAVRETSASEAILTAITYVLAALIVSCPCAIKLIKHSRSAREMILHEIDAERNGQGPPENNGASDPVSSGIRRRPRGGGTEKSQSSITRPKNATTKSVMVDFRIHGNGISCRFHSLKKHEAEELGGLEYRALCVLLWLLPAYIVCWLGLAMVILISWSYRGDVADIIENQKYGTPSPGWWSSFLVVSTYGNCGFSLLDQNMIPF
ncbi:hypothetical protein IMSHALPRED_007558, partial [Imshaugia aleurites]